MIRHEYKIEVEHENSTLEWVDVYERIVVFGIPFKWKRIRGIWHTKSTAEKWVELQKAN